MCDARKVVVYGLLALALLIGGCSGGGGIVKISKFAPPGGVSVEAMQGALKVTWKPSPDEANKWFEGYNVFYSSGSLLLVSVKDLPEPIKVGKEVHEVLIPDLASGKPYFVHVRSRKKGGEMSPPSIPERVGVPAP